MVKLLGVCLVMALFIMVSNEEYKELAFEKSNPKYNAKAQLNKAVIKYAKREGLALN